MKKLFLFGFIVCASFIMNAQQTVFEQSETIYSKETAGGITLHTNGWGLNFYTAKFLSGFSKRMWHFELVGMTSSRQYKTAVERGSYSYGKLNSVTFLRTSYGYQKVFIPRQSIKGVSIGYEFNIGITHGFAKPIYLKIRESNNNYTDQKYDPEKHNRNNIVGKSAYYIGLDETKYYPGLFLRAAINFDYAGKSNMVRAIDVGLSADLFASGIPMMAYSDPRASFLTAFVSLEFGSRKFDGQTKENTADFE